MAIDPDAVRTLAFFKSLYLSQKARSTSKIVDVNSEGRYHLLGLGSRAGTSTCSTKSHLN